MGKTRRGSRGSKASKRSRVAEVKQGSALEAVEKIRASLGNYDGSRPSERRGRVQWSQPDSRTELSRGARVEILRKVRWGYANIGLVRRVVDGLTNLVGYLTPQSKAGGELAAMYEAAWAKRALQPAAFDVAGRLDARTWQRAMTRMRLMDGDNLTVLTEGPSGGARVAFYEAFQVDDGRQAFGDKPAGLHDGVFVNKFGRHVAYRLVDRSGDEEKYSRVRADRCIYHANEEAPGRVRNVSALAHAVANIVDIVEILADTKHAIKIAAQWGVVMQTSAASSSGDVVTDLAQLFGQESAGDDPNGDSAEMNIDQIVAGGRVQGLPAGASMQTLQDTRPHPNQLDLLRWLVRDIAWGVGLAPEVLWDIAGLSGTATRYVMAETQRWALSQQDNLRGACQRMWQYFIAKEVQAGRLPMTADDSWMDVQWIPQADMTIDRGRDTSAVIAMLDKRLISRREIAAQRGRDWGEIEAELKAEEAMIGEND